MDDSAAEKNKNLFKKKGVVDSSAGRRHKLAGGFLTSVRVEVDRIRGALVYSGCGKVVGWHGVQASHAQ